MCSSSPMCLFRGLKFMHNLEMLYEAQNLDSGEVQLQSTPDDSLKGVSMLRLRTIIDDLVEELPPLLELGDVPSEAMATLDSNFDFPYHRPSIISMTSVESTAMPESLGFVLLQVSLMLNSLPLHLPSPPSVPQECLWLNSLLCHIRQSVHEIRQSLLRGPDSIPNDLRDTVISLAEQMVPVAWLHPNCQPSTHSLLSWMEGQYPWFFAVYPSRVMINIHGL